MTLKPVDFTRVIPPTVLERAPRALLPEGYRFTEFTITGKPERISSITTTLENGRLVTRRAP